MNYNKKTLLLKCYLLTEEKKLKFIIHCNKKKETFDIYL